MVAAVHVRVLCFPHLRTSISSRPFYVVIVLIILGRALMFVNAHMKFYGISNHRTSISSRPFAAVIELIVLERALMFVPTYMSFLSSVFSLLLISRVLSLLLSYLSYR